MRNNRRNRVSDIIIDLTSILDVIFILLLVLICGQQNQNDNIAELENEYQQEITGAEAAKQSFEDKLSTLEDLKDNYNEYIVTLSVSAPYEADFHNRTLNIYSDGNELFSTELSGKNTGSQMEEFRNSLAGYLDSHKGTLVVVAVNDNKDKILYRDEKRIFGILDEMSEEYGNLLIRK